MQRSRVVITGATGMIGRALCQALDARNYAIVILSRNPSAAKAHLPTADAHLAWAIDADGPWMEAIDGADAVIHLAGAPIASQRWTAAYKQEILHSRVQGSTAVVRAIAKATRKPRVLISASGVDYYGDRGEQTVDEQSPAGTGFLSQVCVAWEQAAQPAEQHGVRVVCLRTGIVLDQHEGALSRLLPPFRLGLGGPILPGSQWWSWIHRSDVIGLILHSLDTHTIHGPINLTAPNPVRNREFSQILGRVLKRPALIPLPLAPLKLALGELAGPLLVEKQRAIPTVALTTGYQFAYPELEWALRALLAE